MQNDRRANLPANATAAIQRLIQVSQKLVDLSERETQALLQRDMLAFAIIQDEKEGIAGQYTKASEEFRARLEDFRSVEKHFAKPPRNPSEKPGGKNARQQCHGRADQAARRDGNAENTCLMAQEFGQQKRVRMNDNNQIKDRGAE
jgi:hypothetical protein